VGKTPLFNACRSGNKAIVTCLVEHGADVNKENNCGKTPLFIACKSGKDVIAKYLIENGAEVNKKRNKG